MADPGLSLVGERQVSQANAVPVQLVVASHLRRSIETALRLYPAKKVNILCGLDEVFPSPTNQAVSDTIKHLSTADIGRLVIQYNTAKCGLFGCKHAPRFWTQFDDLIREYVKNAGCTSDVHVAVIGHSMWMMLNLNIRKPANLEHIVKSRVIF